MSTDFPYKSPCPICLRSTLVHDTKWPGSGQPTLDLYECNNGRGGWFWIDSTRKAMLNSEAILNRNAVIPGLRPKLAAMERDFKQNNIRSFKGGPIWELVCSTRGHWWPVSAFHPLSWDRASGTRRLRGGAVPAA